jgi:3-oxoadipate enol-lactonase
MPATTANGLTLYYEEHGQGDPLLLIAGLGVDSRSWALQLPALAARFRTVIFDNRGSGHSQKPAGPYTIGQMAEDAAALLDALGIARAHVVGHSMGGMIAQELALAQPGKVSQLVLLSTLARARGPLFDWWMSFSEWAQARSPEPHQFSLWNVPWFFTPAFFSDPAQVEAAIAEAVADPNPISADAFAAQAAACRGMDTLERLGRIEAPTLVLVGQEDVVTPPFYARELAERIPGATLRVLERGGHAMTVEFAADVNAALLEFLTAGT